MAGYNANYRNSGTDRNYNLSGNAGHQTARTPIVLRPRRGTNEIECGESIQDSLTEDNFKSLYRSEDLIERQRYYSVLFSFRLDSPGVATLYVRSGTFVPFCFAVRNDSVKWEANPEESSDSELVIHIEVDADTVGPIVAEVTSVDPYKTGDFEVELVCGETVYNPLVLGTSYLQGSTYGDGGSILISSPFGDGHYYFWELTPGQSTGYYFLTTTRLEGDHSGAYDWSGLPDDLFADITDLPTVATLSVTGVDGWCRPVSGPLTNPQFAWCEIVAAQATDQDTPGSGPSEGIWNLTMMSTPTMNMVVSGYSIANPGGDPDQTAHIEAIYGSVESAVETSVTLRPPSDLDWVFFSMLVYEIATRPLTNQESGLRRLTNGMWKMFISVKSTHNDASVVLEFWESGESASPYGAFACTGSQGSATVIVSPGA